MHDTITQLARPISSRVSYRLLAVGTSKLDHWTVRGVFAEDFPGGDLNPTANFIARGADAATFTSHIHEHVHEHERSPLERRGIRSHSPTPAFHQTVNTSED